MDETKPNPPDKEHVHTLGNVMEAKINNDAIVIARPKDMPDDAWKDISCALLDAMEIGGKMLAFKMMMDGAARRFMSEKKQDDGKPESTEVKPNETVN